ncbi:MAG: response regulator [Spirosomataceae bacterium]
MKKILLIEDNVEIRENTSEILMLDGYDVTVAENGKEGVTKAIAEKPDLIICDIMMPVLDGYGVLHLLTKNQETADIPFIFLTAKAERTDFRKGMDMGADDYITKPFDDVELLNAVESRLRKVEVLNQKYQKTLEGLDNMVRDAGGDEELRLLNERREIRTFKKKAEIYREGAFPFYLFFVIKGKVKTYKTNDDGKELITQLYQAGDYFGHVHLLQETAYQDTAAALEETEICLIPKDDFFSLLFQNRQVAKKFIQLLSAEIDTTENQLLHLAYNSVRKRMAEALLRYFSHTELTERDLRDGIRVGREDLANLAGTSLETAIRTLSDFKDEKLIDITSGRIKILSEEGLRRLRN